MDNPFFATPTHLMGWIAMLGIILVGVFAFINIFDKSLSTKRREVDRLDQELIAALKLRVEALEKDLGEKSKMLVDTNIRMEKLITENETLATTLQGRDESSVERGRLILETVLSTSKSIEKLAKSIDKHLEIQGSKVV